MDGRFGILIMLVFTSGCHYENVFSSNPKESLSFIISAIVAGGVAFLYTKWYEWRDKK